MSSPFKFSVKFVGPNSVSIEALFANANEAKAVIEDFYGAFKRADGLTQPVVPIRFAAANGEFVIDPAYYCAAILVDLDADECIFGALEARKLQIIEAVRAGAMHTEPKM